MRLASLQYLLAVVDAGTFSKAAVALGLNASTLTRQVAALENELGVTLLERSHSGVKVTSGGALVVVEVRRMLAGLDAVTSVARCNGLGKAGVLRLGVRMPPVGEPLRRMLAKWRHDHPGVTLRLHEMSDYELYTAVETRHLDVALVAGYSSWSSVVSETLYNERLFAALPTGHQLSDRLLVDWANLQKETILVQDWPDSHLTREFFASLVGIGISLCPHPVSKQSVFALVGAGFGITLAVESQTHVEFPGVIFKPIKEADAQVKVNMIWAEGAEDAVVGRFTSFMRDQAKFSLGCVSKAIPPQLQKSTIGGHEPGNHRDD